MAVGVVWGAVYAEWVEPHLHYPDWLSGCGRSVGGASCRATGGRGGLLRAGFAMGGLMDEHPGGAV